MKYSLVRSSIIFEICYNFKVDDDNLLDRLGDVYFAVLVKANTDPVKLRDLLPPTIGYVTYAEAFNILCCRSDVETLKKYFGWQVEKYESCKGIAGYTPEGYIEKNRPSMPRGIDDIIAEICLNIVGF